MEEARHLSTLLDAEEDADEGASHSQSQRHQSSSVSSAAEEAAFFFSCLQQLFKNLDTYAVLPRSASARARQSLTQAQPSVNRWVNRLVVPFFSITLAITFVLSLLQPASRCAGFDHTAQQQQAAAPDWSATSLGPPLPRNVQEDLSLPSETCQKEFPALYHQLQANARAWSSRGGLKQSHVQRAWKSCEGGCAHVLISDGHVYIRALAHDWQSRVRAVLALLTKAVESAPPNQREFLEGAEFVFSTADKDGTHNDDGAGWVLDRRVTNPPGQYLIPDFSFAAWPEAGIASYAEFRRDAEAVNAHLAWPDKKDKVFWRGDPTVGSKARQNLFEQIGTDGSTSSWADVQKTSFWEPNFTRIVPPADHCEHKYLLHSEGNAYSGRSKFILSCSSAVVMHKLEWTQYFHPALISQEGHLDQNVIENPRELFEGLKDLIQSLQKSDREALYSTTPTEHLRAMSIGERIASNANRTLTQRYLTPAATACYLRAAIASYNSVLDRSSWKSTPASAGLGGGNHANQEGPRVVLGGGVKPGAGAGKFKGPKLKELHLKGDIEMTTWQLLGQPEWPPK